MKIALALMLVFTTTRPVLGVDTKPVDELIPLLAHNARVAEKVMEFPCVNYKLLKRSDKQWTKGRVFELFKSIDPARIKFDSHKQHDTVIRMVEPIQAVFTFEARKNMRDKGPPLEYFLIKIELAGPANPDHATGKPANGR